MCYDANNGKMGVELWIRSGVSIQVGRGCPGRAANEGHRDCCFILYMTPIQLFLGEWEGGNTVPTLKQYTFLISDVSKLLVKPLQGFQAHI